MQSALLTLFAVVALAATVQAQDDSPGWSLGARYLPQALSPLAYYSVDPGLGAALALQVRVREEMWVEVGGWMADARDVWSENRYALWSGGVVVQAAADSALYWAARGMHLEQRFENWYTYEPEPMVGGGVVLDVAPPVGRSRSTSQTLAASLTQGARLALSTSLSLSFEFGLLYSQSNTTHFEQPPPPPDGPAPAPHQSSYAHSGFGVIVLMGLQLAAF